MLTNKADKVDLSGHGVLGMWPVPYVGMTVFWTNYYLVCFLRL